MIWDSMKMRMKTRMAGRMLAAIIQTGNCPSDPRGEINQPRFSGLDTENPLGTFSFCQPVGRGEFKCLSMQLQQVAMTCPGANLGVGVLHAVVHQHHDQDSDGDAKVSNAPTEL